MLLVMVTVLFCLHRALALSLSYRCTHDDIKQHREKMRVICGCLFCTAAALLPAACRNISYVISLSTSVVYQEF